MFCVGNTNLPLFLMRDFHYHGSFIAIYEKCGVFSCPYLEQIWMNSEGNDVNLAIKFSALLKDALDQIGYPAAPERVVNLMELLELSKPQAYRIMTGKAAPTLSSLMQLRSLDISIDEIFDQLRGESKRRPMSDEHLIEGKIEISGVAVTCDLKLTPLSSHASVVAVPKSDKVWDVMAVSGAKFPEGAMSVQEVRFRNVRPTIAIVDDHPGTLTVLSKQLESHFDAVPFSNGRALLNTLVSSFATFIIDWRLPDIGGEELVKEIRRQSNAPIFVITGETSFRHEIARIIENTDVHYVIKPVDGIILAAQMSQALRNRAP